MDKVVLVTGASSGIGLSTAILFAEKGWRVIATVRDIEKAPAKLKIEKIELVTLDVRKQEDIDALGEFMRQKYGGKIDALINNAGYGQFGEFETVSKRQIEEQYQTNVFGLMEMCRMVIPFMREQGSGVIVNISSIVGRFSMYGGGIYASTKWAVEAFSEQLFFELAQFNIRVKIVEPGPISTDFPGRSLKRGEVNIDAYQKHKEDEGGGKTFKEEAFVGLDSPETVAKVILKAVESNSSRLRYPAGRFAGTIIFLRSILPDFLWNLALSVRRST